MLFKVSLQLTFPSQYLTLMLDTCTGKDAVQSRNQDQSQNSGVLMALFFTKSTLSVMSLLGAIMLIGIVVKNRAINTPLKANGSENMMMNG